jgi:predicted anti-sigma-YlaC factor YlaD
VTTDLMVLYAKGQTSPETAARVGMHLETCEACSKAFGLEPAVKDNVEQPRPYEVPTEFETFLQELYYRAVLPLWGFILHLLARLITLLDSTVRRFGKSTTGLKVRIYRARRTVAGVLTDYEPHKPDNDDVETVAA